MFKDLSREADNDNKDPNSNPLYSGMSKDPNALQTHVQAVLPPVLNMSDVTPPTSPQQPTTSPKKTIGGGLFAKIRALSTSGGGSTMTTTQARQKPKLLLSRIRENRLSRKEVISDSSEMCIKKLVKNE